MTNKIRLCMALTLAFMTSLCVQAQVTIGADKLPETYSVLQLEGKYSSTQVGGLRLPQLSEAEKSRLDLKVAGDKALGLVIFNTTSRQLECWDGSKWRSFMDHSYLQDTDCYGVYDIDGNFYFAGRFGDAGCWMTQNLRVTRYANGDSIKYNNNATDVTDQYYAYPNNNDNILKTNPEYGLLYTWAAATSGDKTDTVLSGAAGIVRSSVQGICPEGWVIPSDKDWNGLEREFVEHASNYGDEFNNRIWNEDWESVLAWRGESLGDVMKSRTKSPFDGRGFGVLCTGLLSKGLAAYYDTNAFFWSSSVLKGEGETSAFFRGVSVADNSKGHRSGTSKTNFMGVRCKKKTD